MRATEAAGVIATVCFALVGVLYVLALVLLS